MSGRANDCTIGARPTPRPPCGGPSATSRLPAPSGTARRGHEQAPRPPLSRIGCRRCAVARRVRLHASSPSRTGVRRSSRRRRRRRRRSRDASGISVSGEAVGIARPVEVLVARAHDVGDVRRGRAPQQDPRSAISVCRRTNSHSSLGERAGLVEDRVRDRHLADVVQLGGEPRRARPRPSGSSSLTRERLGELERRRRADRSSSGWRSESAREQDARSTAPRRSGGRLLLRVHALIGEPRAPRWRSWPRPAEHDHAVRAR